MKFIGKLAIKKEPERISVGIDYNPREAFRIAGSLIHLDALTILGDDLEEWEVEIELKIVNRFKPSHDQTSVIGAITGRESTTVKP